jgi:hypothetical protein
MGGELVPCQAKKTAPRGFLWALHATRDLVSKALLRLFRQSHILLFPVHERGQRRLGSAHMASAPAFLTTRILKAGFLAK